MTELKMRSGDYYVPVTVEQKDDDRLYFSFRYHSAYFPLMEEIKAMESRTWHKDTKQWSIPMTPRNEIALRYLIKGQENPFAIYSQPIVHHEPKLTLWPHQQDMMDFMLTRRKCIVAADTGTGKTLALLSTVLEIGCDPKDVFYVTTTSSIQAFIEELKKWKIDFMPNLMTFERLVRLVDDWNLDTKLPYVLIADESHKLKNKDSSRSKAFKSVADSVRKVYKDGYILLASGTPTPNSPTDYWNQAEIACPGYLRESSPKSLQRTLAFMELVETPHGDAYKVKGWKDDEKKCNHCGEYSCGRSDCKFTKSVNEVQRLYKRLNGLVLVVDKKKVLSVLPDKIYREYKCEPTQEMKDLAENIVDVSPSAITALMKLRALSDGFQYVDTVVGKEKCTFCSGTGKYKQYIQVEADDWFDTIEYEESEEEGACSFCEGTGEADKFTRSTILIDTPKLKALDELLEEYDTRAIVYASFHATIDRVKEHLLSKRWSVFQVDGRGWYGTTPSGDIIPKEDMISMFQSNELDKVVWLGHPATSGTGLTLTASPVAIFYSNSFKGDDRFQAEDRIHRMGMDINKGATIVDISCLPTDSVIREALLSKEKLQNMAMGKVRESLKCKTINL